MKIKVCYIYSDVDYSHLLEANENFINKSKYETAYIFIGQKIPMLYRLFKEKGRPVYFIRYSGKKELIAVTSRIRKIFIDLKPDIVHTHLVNASLAGLTAAKLCGIKKRVHTRHHSMECYLYYPHAVYYDKLVNLLSKKIVAVSQNVFDVLTKRDGTDPNKVTVIRHGFDLAGFKNDETTTEEIKRLYGLDGRYPVVGAISRFVEGKGVQYIIPAFRLLAEKYPQAKLVLANATGPYAAHLKSLLRENLRESQYGLIEFEKRVFDLYKTFDVFLHVPVDPSFEAFGQTYVEALAMKVPSVFTLSGIAADFIKDKGNAVVVPYRDPEAIALAIELILKDERLRQTIIKRGREDVWKMFDANRFVSELDALYSEL